MVVLSLRDSREAKTLLPSRWFCVTVRQEEVVQCRWVSVQCPVPYRDVLFSLENAGQILSSFIP